MFHISDVDETPGVEVYAVEVYVDGDFVVLQASYDYAIPLDQCGTSERILGWVSHLCQKTWVTPDVIQRFIDIAAGENGVKIYSDA